MIGNVMCTPGFNQKWDLGPGLELRLLLTPRFIEVFEGPACNCFNSFEVRFR